jgi:hypothetical protein
MKNDRSHELATRWSKRWKELPDLYDAATARPRVRSILQADPLESRVAARVVRSLTTVDPYTHLVIRTYRCAVAILTRAATFKRMLDLGSNDQTEWFDQYRQISSTMSQAVHRDDALRELVNLRYDRPEADRVLLASGHAVRDVIAEGTPALRDLPRTAFERAVRLCVVFRAAIDHCSSRAMCLDYGGLLLFLWELEEGTRELREPWVIKCLRRERQLLLHKALARAQGLRFTRRIAIGVRAFSEAEVKVLRYLASSRILRFRVEIAAHCDSVAASRTLNRLLPRMEEEGLIFRPCGANSGYTIAATALYVLHLRHGHIEGYPAALVHDGR